MTCTLSALSLLPFIYDKRFIYCATVDGVHLFLSYAEVRLIKSIEKELFAINFAIDYVKQISN